MLARRFLMLAVLSVCLALTARADTVITKDGQRFSGRVVEETPETLKIRGKYGTLTVPKKDVRSHGRSVYLVELKDGSKLEGQILGESAKDLKLKVGGKERTVALAEVKSVVEKKAPPAAQKLKRTQIMGLHRKARAHWDKKDYDRAIAEYAKILSSSPEDTTALYNTACGHALKGRKQQALDFLKKSVEAGFVNFAHIETDTDLDSLRAEAVYKQLLKDRAEYIRKASSKAVGRITKGLAARGIDAKKYKKVVDRKNNFVYLHTRDEEEFAVIRRGLEEYAEYQWKHLFQNKPGSPLYIILLSAKDTPKFFRGRAGGVYTSGMNALFCGDSPAYKLLKTSVIIHEFTHALHFADMAARRQRHPIWLIEGLATLFESSERSPDKVVPRHSHRLSVVQSYLKRRRTLPWSRIMKLSHPQFMADARLTYAQSRYMLFYMFEKGLLKKFYDEYTKGEGYRNDKSAAGAYEVVFGKPLAEVERDWKKWIMAQKVPPMPYLGVYPRATAKGEVRIERLAPGGPAQKAGIKAGDVILTMAGRTIKTAGDVMAAVGAHKVGDQVEVEVRRGEKQLTFTVKLARRGARTSRPPRKGPTPYLGMAVETREGKVFVREVAEGSPAARAGLEAGMQVLEVGGKKVKSTRDYLGVVKKARIGQELKIEVLSGGKEKTLTAAIAELPGGK
jgi:RNase P/RNase MRP subunit p29